MCLLLLWVPLPKVLKHYGKWLVTTEVKKMKKPCCKLEDSEVNNYVLFGVLCVLNETLRWCLKLFCINLNSFI